MVADSGFNGATSRSWWKGRSSVVFAGAFSRCFNGATSRSWWKEPCSLATRSLFPGFNGATSRSWWKGTLARAPSPATSTLQWSHQPELVEGRRRADAQVYPRHRGLQWSHQPELVEGRCWFSLSCSASRGFNGATSRSWWKAGGRVVVPELDALLASMEPPAGAGGRSAAAASSMVPCTALQWSHQPELVEGWLQVRGLPSAGGASMEPPAGAGGRICEEVAPGASGSCFNGATSRSWWKAGDVADDVALARRGASMEPPAGAGGRFHW